MSIASTGILYPLSGMNGYSFSIWFKSSTNQGANYPPLFCFGDSTAGITNLLYLIPVSASALQYRCAGGQATFSTSAVTSNMFDGTWKNIIWTLASTGQSKFYLNGTLLLTGTTGYQAQYIWSQNGLGLGPKLFNNAINCAGFVGLLDGFRIYNDVLTQAQVTSIYTKAV
jgi:hypothetical protein